jgi:hypothetical protein
MDILTNRNDISYKQPQTRPFPHYAKSIRFGMLAGLGMGLYLVLINLLAQGPHPLLSFLKYLILGGFLAVILYQYKKASPAGKTFKNGIRLGLFTSLVAALMLLAFNVLVFASAKELVIITKFQLAADNLFNAVIINGVLFFETLVFGMILTFICLQFLKDPAPAEQR